MKRRAIRCARCMRARRSIDAGVVEDVEGLLSLCSDNAGRVVVSAESARAMFSPWFELGPGEC
jgi:hypothetical protein